VSARKIGFLVLLLAFGAVVETTWSLRGHWSIGPEGCRVIEGRFYGPSYTFEQSAERALTPASGEAAEVEVRNAFGDVRVTAGVPGVVKATLRKVVFQPTEEKARAFAGRVDLRLEGEGGQVRVTTNRGDLERSERVGFETHLEVQAPPDAAVRVRDDHGRVEVTGVARANVASSFGDVALERIAGAAEVDARHGAVRATDIGDALRAQGRYGDVEVTGIKGAASLDVEHGNVTARQTAGLEVKLRYGDLKAEAVGGDLLVRAAHALIEASDVAGRAEAETSYNSVRLIRVSGDVRARAEHGSVTAEEVKGALTAETTHEGVHLARVAGPVELTVEHGGVEASGLGRGARVRSSGDDVSIDGFVGPIEVTVERGGVRLAPRAPIASAITVSSSQGDVRLEVPDGSRIDLDVGSRRGEVRSDVKGLTASMSGQPGRDHRLSGQLGGGANLVRVRAEGDVTIESRPVTPTPAPARPPAERP
jgi:DUF4097 and DUF4098 domain-containing protein YvlB